MSIVSDNCVTSNNTQVINTQVTLSCSLHCWDSEQTGDTGGEVTALRLRCYVLDKLLWEWDEGEVSFLLISKSDVYFSQFGSLIANGYRLCRTQGSLSQLFSDWSLTPHPGLWLVGALSPPFLLLSPWSLLYIGQGQGMAPSSCYLSSSLGWDHITPSRQININHCSVSVHNIYIASSPHSGLSQSDLINSWHKTGPANRTAQAAEQRVPEGRVFVEVSHNVSGNSIIERMLRMALGWWSWQYFVLTPEPPWHLIMAGADEACDRPD